MSFSYSLYAAKTSLTEEEIALAHSKFNKVRPRIPESPWIVFEYGDRYGDDCYDNEKTITPKLSIALEEVVFLMVDSHTDCFYYEHSKNGTLLRKLSWNWNDQERGSWHVVTGVPETWEETALFSDLALKRTLESLSTILEITPRSEEHKAEEERIRALWTSRSYEIGGNYPPADATLGDTVLKFHGIGRPSSKSFIANITKPAPKTNPAPLKSQEYLWAEETIQKLASDKLPVPEDLYSVVTERGNPCGVDEWRDRISAFGAKIDCKRILTTLQAGSDLRFQVSALVLAPHVPMNEQERCSLCEAVMPLIASAESYTFDFHSPSDSVSMKETIEIRGLARQQLLTLQMRLTDKNERCDSFLRGFEILLRDAEATMPGILTYMTNSPRIIENKEFGKLGVRMIGRLSALIADTSLPRAKRQLVFNCLRDIKLFPEHLATFEIERLEILKRYSAEFASKA